MSVSLTRTTCSCLLSMRSPPWATFFRRELIVWLSGAEVWVSLHQMGDMKKK